MMDARKALALVLVVSYCAAQAAGCTTPSGERSRASSGASSGARAVLDDAALTAKDSEDKARRAGEIARQVEGVKQVYNDIRIAPRA